MDSLDQFKIDLKSFNLITIWSIKYNGQVPLHAMIRENMNKSETVYKSGWFIVWAFLNDECSFLISSSNHLK